MLSVSLILVGLIVVGGIHAAMAAPDWLPEGIEIAGYTLVWDNEVTVNSFQSNDSNDNITCYTQLWLKEGDNSTNASLIGASMLSRGGEFFNTQINLSSIPSWKLQILKLMSGLSESELLSITTIWELMVAIVKAQASSNNSVSEPTIGNVDHALLIEFPEELYFNYVLLATKEDRVIVTFNFDAEQDWIDWIYGNNTQNLILTRYQLVVWGFWQILAVFITIITWLSQSGDLNTSSVESAIHDDGGTKSISTCDYASTSEMITFVDEWGKVVSKKPLIAGYDISLMVAAIAFTAIAVINIKRKKPRKS